MGDVTVTASDGIMATISGVCSYCKREWVLLVRGDDAAAWLMGEYAQNVWPDWTADQREMLISGMHGHCFDKACGPDPDDEDDDAVYAAFKRGLETRMSDEVKVLLDSDLPCEHDMAGEHETIDGEWCYGMATVRLVPWGRVPTPHFVPGESNAIQLWREVPDDLE